MKHRSSSSPLQITDTSAQGTLLLQPTRRRWLSSAAAWLTVASVSACGGGGGDGNEGGGDGGGGSEGSGPTGLIVVKSIDVIEVHNASSRESKVYASSSTGLRLGVAGSRNGVIGDVSDEDSRGSWKIRLLDAKTGAVRQTLAIARELATATSPVSVNADATRIAFSVNEPTSPSDNTRVDRSFVGDLATLALTRVEGASDPVFVGSELMVRRGERLHLLNVNLEDQRDLGVTVSDRLAAAAVSGDGRYIAYDRDEQVWVLDRQTNRTWEATGGRSTRSATFSPDGRYMALLRGGSTAGVYVHVIPFTPDTKVEVTDANMVMTAAGELVAASGGIAWVNA
jgi:hypothetical protein